MPPLSRNGELGQALVQYREAIELDPASAVAHRNLVFVLPFQPGESAADMPRRRGWASDTQTPDPFADHPNAPEPARRLRIGYVAADFRDHCQALFLLPLSPAPRSAKSKCSAIRTCIDRCRH